MLFPPAGGHWIDDGGGAGGRGSLRNIYHQVSMSCHKGGGGGWVVGRPSKEDVSLNKNSLLFRAWIQVVLCFAELPLTQNTKY